jgi:hypothetical protein
MDGKPAEGAGQYEFGPDESKLIKRLSGSMFFVGVMTQLFGLLEILAGFSKRDTDRIVAIVEGVLMLLIGGWLYRAAASFQKIVDTSGSDVSHLMAALRRLRSVFALQAFIFGLVCILVIVGIVVEMTQ